MFYIICDICLTTRREEEYNKILKLQRPCFRIVCVNVTDVDVCLHSAFVWFEVGVHDLVLFFAV